MRRNWRLLLLQGTFYTTGIQLSSVTVVGAYLIAQLTEEKVLIGLLIPLYTVGALLGNVLAPRLVGRAGSVITLLAAVAAGQTVLIVAMAADIALLPPEVAVLLLLGIAAVIGVVSGCSLVIFPLAASALLSDQRRGELFLRQAGYGAIVMTVIAAYSVGFFSDDSPGLDDAELLWLGAAAMAVAAGCCYALRRNAGPVASAVTGETTRIIRRGCRYFVAEPWFRQFTVIQLTFAGVTLGSMFFGIYSSDSLGVDNGKLDTMLVFVGCGLLGGIWLWGYIRQRFDARGMFMASAAIGTTAAALCLIPHLVGGVDAVWIFGIVMLLAAVANQAIYPAAQDWIFDQASEDMRVVAISFSQLVTGIGFLPIAFLMSVVAAHGNELWPVLVIVAINVAGLVAARRVPRRGAANIRWTGVERGASVPNPRRP